MEPGARDSVRPVSTAGPERLTRADVMSVREVADLLHCSTRHVYELAGRDALPGARRLGRKLLVSRRVLEAWLLADQ
jgi:excisionase family DNA binding protein